MPIELHPHPVTLLHFPTWKNYQVALQHGNFPLKENTGEGIYVIPSVPLPPLVTHLFFKKKILVWIEFYYLRIKCNK